MRCLYHEISSNLGKREVKGKKRTGKLRRGGTHDSDEGSNVDDRSANTEALGRIGLVLHDFCQYIQSVTPDKKRERDAHLLHGQDSILASKPDALDIDILSEVPDLLLGIDGVVISGVHNTSVVELFVVMWVRLQYKRPKRIFDGAVDKGGRITHEHIQPSKHLHGLIDHGLHLLLLAHITFDGDSTAFWEMGVDELGSSLDIGEVDIRGDESGALSGKLESGLKTNTAVIS